LVEGSAGVVGEFLEESFGFFFCESPHLELCLCRRSNGLSSVGVMVAKKKEAPRPEKLKVGLMRRLGVANKKISKKYSVPHEDRTIQFNSIPITFQYGRRTRSQKKALVAL
jgi:hypothetical protein